MIRSQKVPIRPIYNPSLTNEIVQPSTNAGDITSYIGKTLTINHHQVIVEDILGQGGFAFVFLVRSYNQHRYALKRMYVNNPHDLLVCQREISLVRDYATHPNIVKYVDSYIHRLSPTNIQRRPYQTERNDNDDDGIYEILFLTEYCSNGALIVSNHNIYKTVSSKLTLVEIISKL
jgi:AP2-associated kinase